VLTIGTTNVKVDEAQAKLGGDRRAGKFVCLSVRDSGRGMGPEIQEHLFEPFYTVSADSKGIGLGLATVYGAVKQQNGWIEFFSELGTGTEFRIFLPTTAASAAEPEEDAFDPSLLRGTVLLVDADERTRKVSRYVLNRQGYQVIEAGCRSVAQILWENQAEAIDLLLTDARLPDGSGCDLANQLRQIKPNLKVIYTSDSPLDATSQKLALRDGFKFLAKSCSPDQLIQAVQAFLGRQE
jgi:CheY-like chemotaxis protein